MAKADKYLVHTAGKTADDSFPFRHPFNANSHLALLPLSDQVGLQRMGISIGRIPPGKEGFLPHAHAGQEEFIFVLEGEGVLTIDNEKTSLSPGDFVGFPTDGAVHHVSNESNAEFVYLMGGERTATDVAYFPTIGKKGFWADGTMRYVDDEAITALKPEDFVARKDG